MTESITLLPADPESLDPAWDNPRSDLGDLAGLVASIREHGILEPIIVTPGLSPGRFTIVAGHRRVAAAIELGLAEVHVIVQYVEDDADRQQKMLIENLHRKDLSTLDKARGFKALADSGMSQRQIAEKVGLSQSMVSKHLSLTKLPEPVLGLLAAGELSQEDAVTLTGLPADSRKDIFTDMEDAAKAGEPLTGGEVARAIDFQKQEADVAAAFKAQVAGLEAQGVKFVLEDDVQWEWSKTGPVSMGCLYWVPANQHKKLPCRAVSVRFGKHLVEVCTEPVGHPKPVVVRESPARPGKVESNVEAKEREAAEAFRVDLAEANRARLRWLESVTGDSAGIAEATLQLVLLLGEPGVLDLGDLMNLLGVAYVDPGPYGQMQREAIIAACVTDDMRRQAAFLALALDAENAFDQTGIHSTPFGADAFDRVRGLQYLELLGDLGYERSWIESKYLNEPYEEPQMPGTSSPATEEGASDAEDEIVTLTEDLQIAEPPGTDSSTADEGTESVPPRSDPAMPVREPTIEIKPKYGKNYVYCSIHGHVGVLSKLEDAEEKGRIHLRDEHGITVAA